MLKGAMAHTKKPDTFLSLKDVADQLGENVETVRGWRRRGLFPNAVRIDTLLGPIWQIPLRDVESFVKPPRGRPPTQTRKKILKG